MIDIEQRLWGMTNEGEAIILYSMKNAQGVEIRCTNLGARVVGVLTPDRRGELKDILLGYQTAENYLNDSSYMGACLGRCAGRLANGQFELGGNTYVLDRNEGRHHLNGGVNGFSSKLWESRVETNRIVMSLASTDGEGNYPGEIHTEVIFDLDEEGGFELTYLAKSNRDTLLDMSHHLLFDLTGNDGKEDILNHELQINAHRTAEINLWQLPTGRLFDVEGSALDFTQFHTIGERIASKEHLISELEGYAHPYLIDGWQQDILGEVATLREPTYGRQLTLLSSQPALILETGNLLSSESQISKTGHHYASHSGLSLTMQHLPDAIHHPEFQTPILKAEELYCQKTVLRFSTFEN